MKKLILILIAAVCAYAAAMSAAAQELKPGDKFYHCDDCPEMVVVPPGSFLMGSPYGEEGRDDDEGPVHRVTIDYMFAVGVHEVTFDEWDYCVEQGGCRGYSPEDEGWGRLDMPVINVSWEDAKAYTAWLSRETGEPYRLLTEAEWEYAARAGTTTPFHFGNTISANQANYNGNFTYGSGSKGKYRQRTIPVGVLPANKFGLRDVHGNVWEWTEDCWHDSYEGAPADGSAWLEDDGGDCSRRVVRVIQGGSSNSDPRNFRSAYRKGSYAGNCRADRPALQHAGRAGRSGNNADLRNYSNGFRVAL